MVLFFILIAEPCSLQQWTASLQDDVESDEEDEEMDAEIEGAAPTASRILKVQKAYRQPEALSALHLCVIVLGEITQLIVDSSAESCHVPTNLLSRLNLLGMKLEAASKVDQATMVMC